MVAVELGKIVLAIGPPDGQSVGVVEAHHIVVLLADLDLLLNGLSSGLRDGWSRRLYYRCLNCWRSSLRSSPRIIISTVGLDLILKSATCVVVIIKTRTKEAGASYVL